ncbi:MAG: DUF1810 domain-containing protein [Flavobacterium sp.]|nr:DUF1810 domain-containing protein [Flavobacterium sp.]
MTMENLKRFLDAQNQTYLKALDEIRNGRKTTHWMWFVFPQITGLGQSDIAKFYSIKDIDEASAYVDHPVLGKHLIEISTELLHHANLSAHEIFGSPDDVKLRSSMTLFANVPNVDPIFANVLDAFFEGKQDEKTIQILLRQKIDHVPG